MLAPDVRVAMGLPSDRPHWITTNWWRAECALGGMGMIVFSPEGTRYEMTTPGLRLGAGSRPQSSWYTTRIVDRNGNRLEIGYVASDNYPERLTTTIVSG